MAAKTTTALVWSNIITFVLVVIVNGLAGSTTLIGGKVTAEISDANPTLVTPAGFTFSIWSIIYILLAAFVIYQALPGQRTKAFQSKVGWLFVLSNVFNIAWLFVWQYEVLVVSVVIMFLLLISLILIYTRLDVGRAKVAWGERLAVHLPFSVYLGWITIATIANVSATLVSLDWDGFGIAPEIWAVVILLVALLITVLVAFTRRDIAYVAVIVWALAGIAANQSDNGLILTVAIGCAVVAVIALVASILYARRPFRKKAGL